MLQETDKSTAEPSGSRRASWSGWLQQAATLIYFVAGIFLIYQYAGRLHQRVVLITGILFVLYGVYRFFLVRRSARR
jgi:hypothetical protein